MDFQCSQCSNAFELENLYICYEDKQEQDLQKLIGLLVCWRCSEQNEESHLENARNLILSLALNSTRRFLNEHMESLNDLMETLQAHSNALDLKIENHEEELERSFNGRAILKSIHQIEEAKTKANHYREDLRIFVEMMKSGERLKKMKVDVETQIEEEEEESLDEDQEITQEDDDILNSTKETDYFTGCEDSFDLSFQEEEEDRPSTSITPTSPPRIEIDTPKPSCDDSNEDVIGINDFELESPIQAPSTSDSLEIDTRMPFCEEDPHENDICTHEDDQEVSAQVMIMSDPFVYDHATLKQLNDESIDSSVFMPIILSFGLDRLTGMKMRPTRRVYQGSHQSRRSPSPVYEIISSPSPSPPPIARRINGSPSLYRESHGSENDSMRASSDSMRSSSINDQSNRSSRDPPCTSNFQPSTSSRVFHDPPPRSKETYLAFGPSSQNGDYQEKCDETNQPNPRWSESHQRRQRNGEMNSRDGSPHSLQSFNGFPSEKWENGSLNGNQSENGEFRRRNNSNRDIRPVRGLSQLNSTSPGSNIVKEFINNHRNQRNPSNIFNGFAKTEVIQESEVTLADIPASAWEDSPSSSSQQLNSEVKEETDVNPSLSKESVPPEDVVRNEIEQEPSIEQDGKRTELLKEVQRTVKAPKPISKLDQDPLMALYRRKSEQQGAKVTTTKTNDAKTKTITIEKSAENVDGSKPVDPIVDEKPVLPPSEPKKIFFNPRNHLKKPPTSPASVWNPNTSKVEPSLKKDNDEQEKEQEGLDKLQEVSNKKQEKKEQDVSNIQQEKKKQELKKSNRSPQTIKKSQSSPKSPKKSPKKVITKPKTSLLNIPLPQGSQGTSSLIQKLGFPVPLIPLPMGPPPSLFSLTPMIHQPPSPMIVPLMNTVPPWLPPPPLGPLSAPPPLMSQPNSLTQDPLPVIRERKPLLIVDPESQKTVDPIVTESNRKPLTIVNPESHQTAQVDPAEPIRKPLAIVHPESHEPVEVVDVEQTRKPLTIVDPESNEVVQIENLPPSTSIQGSSSFSPRSRQPLDIKSLQGLPIQFETLPTKRIPLFKPKLTDLQTPPPPGILLSRVKQPLQIIDPNLLKMIDEDLNPDPSDEEIIDSTESSWSTGSIELIKYDYFQPRYNHEKAMILNSNLLQIKTLIYEGEDLHFNIYNASHLPMLIRFRKWDPTDIRLLYQGSEQQDFRNIYKNTFELGPDSQKHVIIDFSSVKEIMESYERENSEDHFAFLTISGKSQLDGLGCFTLSYSTICLHFLAGEWTPSLLNEEPRNHFSFKNNLS